MKIFLLKKTLKCLFYAVLLGISLPFSAQNNNSDKIFTYTPEGLTYFQISKQDIIVKFNQQTPESTIINFLNSQAEIENVQKENILPSPKNLGFITLVEPLDKIQLLDLLTRLEQHPDVEYAQMILQHECSNSRKRIT